MNSVENNTNFKQNGIGGGLPSLEENNHHNNSPQTQSQQQPLLPVFPKANSILFNTGNIVSTERLKRRSVTNPQEEVLEALNNTLQRWIGVEENTATVVNDAKSIVFRHPDYYERLTTPEERVDTSISVKLFLNTFDPEVLERAINTIMDEIGTTQIDTLVLSLPDKLFSHDDLPKDLMLPLWAAVQKSIQNEKVITAGLADFNAKYLEQLCDSLGGDKKFAPSLNQVNLTSCCKMPEDLVEYAKINNIQLTTHIDPREILSVESLQACLRKNLHDYDSQGWNHLWLARYTLILKGRGIVKSKGYIVNAQRELRYTKQN